MDNILNKKVEYDRTCINYTGFMNINPYSLYYPYKGKIVEQFMVKTEQFKYLLRNNKPYYLLITLTFEKHISFNERCQFANTFIAKFNKKIFNWDYKIKNRFIEGFAFIEDHLSAELEDKQHIHMLIKDNTRLRNRGFVANKGIFSAAFGKVLDGENRPVFYDKCNHIEYVLDDGAIVYCMKHIWDYNLDRIKFIGMDGLSDNLKI